MVRIEPLAGVRQRNESNKAVQACNDYLRMGPGRSLRELWRQYAEKDQIRPPTRSLTTLKGWSSRYCWQERIEQWDAKLEAEKTARAEEIMQTGLALTHNRVENLKTLAAFLKEQIEEQGVDGVYHNIWLPDVKQIGAGRDAERVDIERFNAPLIHEYRAALEDIAKEVGGRQKHRQNVNIDVTQLTIEQLERIAKGEDPVRVLATTPGNSGA